jgi:hypothetical protein
VEPLEQATTEELIDQLCKRADNLVIAWTQGDPHKKTVEQFRYRRSGSFPAAIGLLEWTKVEIMSQMVDSDTIDDEEQDDE